MGSELLAYNVISLTPPTLTLFVITNGNNLPQRLLIPLPSTGK